MNQHAPYRWWRLLSIVLSTQLSMITSMELKNPSELAAQSPESLLAHGSAGRASAQDVHSVPIEPESITEQSPDVAPSSSISVAKHDDVVNKHIFIDLSGVKRSYERVSPPKSQPNDSEDQESRLVLTPELEDIDVFVRSYTKFAREYTPSDYAKAGKEGMKELVVKLSDYNKEITQFLKRKLASKYDDQNFTSLTNEMPESPPGEQEHYLQHNYLQVARREDEASESLAHGQYQSIVKTQSRIDEIVEGLQECLHRYEFPQISDRKFVASKAKEEEEPVVKIVFQAIEYMHRYSLITRDQMSEFFDDKTIQIAGNHLASIQLFGGSQELWHFTPEIEELRDDWKTFHLHKCLNDLYKDEKGAIIQAAIGTLLKALGSGLLPGREYVLGYPGLEFLSMQDMENIGKDRWEYFTKFYAEKFQGSEHPHQGSILEFQDKINFYMLDFVLRYCPYKFQIFKKQKTETKFLLNFAKVKLSYRSFNLERLAIECFNQCWNPNLKMPDTQIFTQREWIEKHRSLLEASHEIRKVMDSPSKAIAANKMNLGWIKSLDNNKGSVYEVFRSNGQDCIKITQKSSFGKK